MAVHNSIPGSDLIISLGSFSPVTDQIQAGTLMNELGHNLGLLHGGNEPFVNNKPIDWNCDGDTVDQHLTFDVNNDGTATKLTGFNDWEHIQFKGGSVGGAGESFQPQSTHVDSIT